jgi:hypothetical protein
MYNDLQFTSLVEGTYDEAIWSLSGFWDEKTASEMINNLPETHFTFDKVQNLYNNLAEKLVNNISLSNLGNSFCFFNNIVDLSYKLIKISTFSQRILVRIKKPGEIESDFYYILKRKNEMRWFIKQVKEVFQYDDEYKVNAVWALENITNVRRARVRDLASLEKDERVEVVLEL